jgi:hypothetical protein
MSTRSQIVGAVSEDAPRDSRRGGQANQGRRRGFVHGKSDSASEPSAGCPTLSNKWLKV